MGGCPGWPESSLGAHSFCWFFHVATQFETLPAASQHCKTQTSESPLSWKLTHCSTKRYNYHLDFPLRTSWLWFLPSIMVKFEVGVDSKILNLRITFCAKKWHTLMILYSKYLITEEESKNYVHITASKPFRLFLKSTVFVGYGGGLHLY